MCERMTPLELQILLHYHCYPRKCDLAASPAGKRCVARLLKKELIQTTKNPAGYITTPRGFAFIRRVCSTRLADIEDWLEQLTMEG